MSGTSDIHVIDKHYGALPLDQLGKPPLSGLSAITPSPGTVGGMGDFVSTHKLSEITSRGRRHCPQLANNYGD